MLVITYFDWFGEPEDFEKFKNARKEVCAGIKGAKHLGTYASHQAKYHYAFIEEYDSYDRRAEISSKVWEKLGSSRDRNVITHSSSEIFTEA